MKLTRTVDLVYGRTGAGKSVLARVLLHRRQLGSGRQGVIIDTLNEYGDYPLIDLSSLPAVLDRLPQDEACRVLCPGLPDLELAFEAVRGAGGAVVLVDEVSYWSKSGWLAPGLSEAVRYGRHDRISLVCVSRRPAETARELSAQATMLHSFKVIEPVDLAYFSRILPESARAILPSLPEYHYLSYSADGTYKILPPVNLKPA